jgi:hypothetical protein
MDIDEAVKYCKGKKVLVAEQDLESENEVIGFERKTFQECKEIIERSETIAKICDDFLNQLRVFSEKQEDVISIRPIGTMSTILVHDPFPDSEEQEKEQKTNKRSGNY